MKNRILPRLVSAILLLIGMVISSLGGSILDAWPSVLAFGLPFAISMMATSTRLVPETIYKRSMSYVPSVASVVLSLAIIRHDYSIVFLPESSILVIAYITIVFLVIGYALLSVTQDIELSRAARSSRNKGNGSLHSLEQSWTKIKSSVSALQATISAEKVEIARAMASFQGILKKQEVELSIITSEIQTKKTEAELVSKVSKMNEPEVALFFDKLRKMRYLDYLVGFVLGILGTIVCDNATEFIMAILGSR